MIQPNRACEAEVIQRAKKKKTYLNGKIDATDEIMSNKFESNGSIVEDYYQLIYGKKASKFKKY